MRFSVTYTAISFVDIPGVSTIDEVYMKIQKNDIEILHADDQFLDLSSIQKEDIELVIE